MLTFSDLIQFVIMLCAVITLVISGSAEDASSYYYDDLEVYRDYDPYL